MDSNKVDDKKVFVIGITCNHTDYVLATEGGTVMGFNSFRHADNWMGLSKSKDKGKKVHTVACEIAVMLDPRVVETSQKELKKCVKSLPKIPLIKLSSPTFGYHAIPLGKLPETWETAPQIDVGTMNTNSYAYEITRGR